MPKIQKTRQKRGLADAAVFIEDTSRRSPDYLNITQLGDEIALGKNGFRIQGASTLDPGSRVEVEVTDSRGGVIYHEVRDYAEDVSRVIGVFVYEDTPPGPATVTVLAKARQQADGAPIPEEWEGKMNLKWQRRVEVNVNTYNNDLIRFERTPELLVTSENYTKKRPVLAGTLSSFEKVGAYVPPIDLIEGIDVDLDFEDYDAFPVQTVDVDPAVPRISTTLFPENQYGYDYLVATSADFDFVSAMEGRLLVIAADALPLGVDLVARITEVVNANTVRYNVLTEAYRKRLVKDRLTGVERFSIVYRRDPVAYSDVEEVRIDRLQLGFMKTIVGEAVRARVYNRVEGGNDEFALVGDFEIEPTELLTDRRPDRSTLVRPAGVFRDQVDVDRYLSLDTPQRSMPLTYDDDTLSRAVRLRPAATGAVEHGFSFDLEFLDITFFEYSEYTLSFQSVFEATRAQDSVLEVVVTGDAFLNRTDVIARVDLSDARYDERRVEENFFPLRTSRARGVGSQGAPVEVRFRVLSDADRDDWSWYVRDVSVVPAQEAGFSPDYAIIPTEVDRSRFDQDDLDRLQYKVDIFDIDNNKAGVQVTSD